MGVDIYKVKPTFLENAHTFTTIKVSNTGVQICDTIPGMGLTNTGTFHAVVNDRLKHQPPYPSGY